MLLGVVLGMVLASVDVGAVVGLAVGGVVVVGEEVAGGLVVAVLVGSLGVGVGVALTVRHWNTACVVNPEIAEVLLITVSKRKLRLV